ncbi:hypothetical protein BKA80DRAFT_54374 [Phyllosticta citrichinensis]
MGCAALSVSAKFLFCFLFLTTLALVSNLDPIPASVACALPKQKSLEGMNNRYYSHSTIIVPHTYPTYASQLRSSRAGRHHRRGDEKNYGIARGRAIPKRGRRGGIERERACVPACLLVSRRRRRPAALDQQSGETEGIEEVGARAHSAAVPPSCGTCATGSDGGERAQPGVVIADCPPGPPFCPPPSPCPPCCAQNPHTPHKHTPLGVAGAA